MRVRGLLVAIVILAAALRVVHLGAESVWLDEAASIQIASDPAIDVLHDAAQDVHPPLYYLILHAWMRVAGDSESAVRWLSVIISLLAVLAVARCAARWLGRETALVAALLAAISPLAIAFAQEARMYALLSLLATLSVDEFLRLVTTGRRGAWIRYVLATAAMLYTHAYAGFVMAGEALWLVGVLTRSPGDRARVWRRGGLAISLAVIAFLPWVPSFLSQVRGVEHYFWIPPSGTLAGALEAQAGSLPLAVMFVALAACACVPSEMVPRAPTPGRISPGMAPQGLFLAVVVCVIGIPFALSRVSSPIFLPKYTIAALPAFVMLAAGGVMRVPGRPLRIGVVAGIVALTMAPLAAYVSTRHKDDWRAVAAAVEQKAEPGDLVVFSQPFATAPFEYYARRTDLVELPFLDGVSAGLTSHSLDELARVATAGYDRVWLVRSDPDAATAAMTKALQGYERVEQTSGGGVDVALYVRRNTPPGWSSIR